MGRHSNARALAAMAESRAQVAVPSAIAGAVASQFSALQGEDGISAWGGGTPLLRWWRPGRLDASGDTLRVLPTQRGQSRELARTNPIAGGAIDTNVNRVVGTGLALVAQPDRRVLGWDEDTAKEWKRTTQNEFSLYADSVECDIAGQQTFYEKQGLTLRASLESGDAFTVLPDGEPTGTQPYRLRIQTIEADRVGNPNANGDTFEIAGGIKRDPATGAASSYYVYDQHPGSILIGSGPRFQGVWIDRIGTQSGRRKILHHFRALRPEQPRGVPYLSIIAEHLKQLGRYTQAEIMAAVASANITGVVTSPAATGAAPIFGIGEAEAAANPEIAMAPGAVIGLAPGEEFTLADPSRPNTAFQPFILAIIQQIGVGLGIPFELLIKQFNASYSASKAALLDAWMRFRAERVWLARSFCQPIYETWLAEAVATGRVKAPGFFTDPLMRWAYTRATWHGDSQGSINPKDEVDAYLAAVEGRIMSRERAEWELFGTDWYQTYDSKLEEQKMLKADDMLPVPKAGAPSPGDTPTGPSESDKAFAAMASSIATMAAREAPAINLTVNTPPVNVEVHTPPVTVEGHEINVHTPESTVNLEATVQAPTVHVDFAMPEAQVVVNNVPQAMRQVITRDAADNITQIVTQPLQES